MALFMDVVRIVGVTADSFDRLELFFRVRGDGAEEHYARHGVPGTRSEKHRIGDFISKNLI